MYKYQEIAHKLLSFTSHIFHSPTERVLDMDTGLQNECYFPSNINNIKIKTKTENKAKTPKKELDIEEGMNTNTYNMLSHDSFYSSPSTPKKSINSNSFRIFQNAFSHPQKN